MTGNSVKQWKEHFKGVLNQVNMYTFEEAESEDLGVRCVHYHGRGCRGCQKASRWQSASGRQDLSWDAEDSGSCGAVMVNMSLQCHIEVLDISCGLADQVLGSAPFFQKGLQRVCSNCWRITLLRLTITVYSRMLRGGQPIVEPRRITGAFILVMELWTTSLPFQGC